VVHFAIQNERDTSAGIIAAMQSMVKITDFVIDDTESFTVRILKFAFDSSLLQYRL
jgi:hypothetical protein